MQKLVIVDKTSKLHKVSKLQCSRNTPTHLYSLLMSNDNPVRNATQGHVMFPDKKLPPQVRGYPRPLYTRPVRYDMFRHPADPRAGHPADPRAAHPADPRAAHPADPRAAHPAETRTSSTRPAGRQVQRSHSTLGYLQRHHRTMHSGQRSQSLNRVSEPQSIEMSALNTNSTQVSCRTGHKSDRTVSPSKTTATATSSVASSSTVADIVDL